MNKKPAVQYLLYAFVTAVALVIMLPLYWMFTGSFKEMKATMKVPPDFIPIHPILDNYKMLFETQYNVLRWVGNSILIAGGTTVLCMVLCAMMGYVFAKKEFPLKNVLFLSVLVTLMFPKQVAIVPLYLTVKDMGMLDNYWGVILPNVAWPMGVYLMRQFIYSIPDSLLEAARLDGASETWIFARLIMPLTKPALASLGILIFMFSWGDFLWQIITLKNIDLWTINVGMSVISKVPIGGATTVNYGLLMAGGTVGALPVVLMFIMLQRFFVEGIVVGALKE